MMQEFKKLKIWQKAMEVTVDIYKITADYPKAEIYGLTSQMRRASVSIVSNIAEGAGRNNPKEFIQFLGYSQASATELETQLLVSSQVGFLNESIQCTIEAKIIEIQKMNRALQTSIRNAIYEKKSSAFIPKNNAQEQTNRMTK
jgi:four helix bundle protein